jgi:hypothetical protein
MLDVPWEKGEARVQPFWSLSGPEVRKSKEEKKKKP